jgi:hypothetical protein
MEKHGRTWVMGDGISLSTIDCEQRSKDPTDALISLISGKTMRALHSRVGLVLTFAPTPFISLWHTAIQNQAN